MRAEMRAAMLRFLASLHERAAMQLRLAAAATLAAESFRGFTDAMQTAVDRELAEHPDMAELNVQLDARYEVGP